MFKRLPRLKFKVSFSFHFRLEIGRVVVNIHRPRVTVKKSKSR